MTLPLAVLTTAATAPPETEAPLAAHGHADLPALLAAGLGPLPAALLADLRTDHAGETGAVFIYRGILAVTRNPALRAFAQAHGATESEHLALMEAALDRRHRSLLLPVWRVAGWLTGALPALSGPLAVYATIEAVETFVDQHYGEQVARIDRLDPACQQRLLQALRELLAHCRADEVAHRDEAAAHRAACASRWPFALRGWAWLVGAGSRAAVAVCRWV